MHNSTQIGWEISETANKFKASIVLKFDNVIIDAKSILGVFVTLQEDFKYELHVIGPDAEEAKQAMREVFAKNKLHYIFK